MSAEEYDFVTTTNDDGTISCKCLYCTVNFLMKILRSHWLGMKKFSIKINNSDSMTYCEFLPTLDSLSETVKYVNIHLENGSDVDQIISSLLSTKYYGTNAFQ